ncbi:MAG: YkgJ family cysteine cluster protein [Vicinamibacteria bacterium]|nr:YkgJ family cysteine cluster protein [Vicinamibacteria bacterium]
MTLVFDAEQNFTCLSCGECCRRAFDIVVTDAEKERLEARNAGRWFRETASEEPGAASSPFEFAGTGLLRIRKRPDGVCGFLSAENRCRIHEELGGSAKPLTCQMFPFSFDAMSGETRVSSSFCCPTVARNEGRSLEAQQKEIGSLARSWRLASEPSDRPLEWVKGVPLDPDALESMRWVFRRLLDLHRPTFSIRRNLRRIAMVVDDWMRPRVLKLDREKFEEYLSLTGEFAVAKPLDPLPQTPRIARFLFRGFFFASLVPLTSRVQGRASGLGLRLRLLRLLLHVHGIGPSFHGINFGKGRRKALDLDAEPFFTPAYHALRAAIENLGSGRRPVVDELSLGVAHVLVAEHLFLARLGKERDLSAWIRAIMDAHDVAHADPASTYGRFLVSLIAPPSSLHLFGAR